MSRYTQGPWEVQPGVYDCCPEASEFPHGPELVVRGQSIASFQIYGEDNAALCSAAPELLAELKELYAVVLGECPSLLNEDSGGASGHDGRIRAAIAKAERSSL